ncbi:MAG: branched-chain amino acid ABC transporter permease [Peptostreptococcales bacterium]
MLFIQHMISGLNVGSIYALIALGYTMVYGIVRLINFAHGDILMMGAYFAFIGIAIVRLPFWIVLIISMALCAIAGMLIDRIAYRPLRDAHRLSALITAIGMSLFLENLFLILFGAEPKKMPMIIKSVPIQISGIQITYITVITLALSIVCMVALDQLVNRTKTGKAMRAVSEDKDASKLMGINVNKTIGITFAIGSALGAVGGILFVMAYPQVNPYMGMMPGLKAFVAAVLGGIGIIPGAMLGGYVLGIVESLTRAYISSRWADFIVFSILIIVLLVKPTGILGKNGREKV